MQIHKCTDKQVLVERGPVFVRLLDGVTTERSDIDYACVQFERMLRHYPAIATLAIIEHGTPIPSSEVGRHCAEQFGRFGQRLVFASALLGLGFWAKAASSITVGLMRRVSSFTVVWDTTLSGAVNKLADELIGVDPQELLQTCERIRAREL